MKTNTSFEKNSTIIFFLSLFAGGLNYLFQILSGRFLSSSDYGTVNALFSIMNIATVIGSAMGLSIARHIAKCDAVNNYILASIVKHGVIVGFPIAVLIALCAESIVGCGVWTSAIVAIASIVISFSSIFNSVLQGQQKFLQYGITNIIQPLFKTISGLALLLLGIRYNFVFVAILVGALIAIAYSRLSITKLCDVTYFVDQASITNLYKSFLTILISSGCLIVFTNADVLLVKHIFDSDIVGFYSAASTIGKIILYIPSAIVAVMIPAVANDTSNRMSILLKTFLYSLLISGTACVCFCLLDDFAIKLLFGNKYLEATKYVLSICSMTLSIVCVTISANYLIAINHHTFAAIFGSIAIVYIIFVVSSFSHSIITLISHLTAVYFVLFIILMIKILGTRRLEAPVNECISDDQS